MPQIKGKRLTGANGQFLGHRVVTIVYTSNLKVFRHMELTDCFVYDQLILNHPETYLYYDIER